MAKEVQNPSLPLPTVLAEEFAQLHGHAPGIDGSKAVPDQLKEYWAAVHGLGEQQAALCISGGGIRSATFALGILQGLARCGLLHKFHYLSTVSGGGYIGGWLTAWIHNAERGLAEVCGKLSQPRRHTRPNPEAVQIRNLRSYSNYLSPRLGVFSADAWTLAATYLRNLLLNWLVLIPLLAAILTVPWIYTTILMNVHYTLGLLVPGGLFAVIGIAYMGFNLPCGGNKRGSQPLFLLLCLLPILLCAICLTIHWGWFRYYERPLPVWSFLGLTKPHESVGFIYLGVGIHLISWVSSLLQAHGFRWKELVAVIASGGIGGWLLWLGARKIFNQPLAFGEFYTVFAVPIFLTFIFLAIMAFAGISSRWTSDPDREWWGRAAGWFLALAIGWVAMSAIVIFGPLAFFWTTSTLSTISAGGIAGALTIWASRSSSIPATEKGKEKASRFANLMAKAATLAAALFIVVFMILIIWGTTSLVKGVGKFLEIPWDLESKSHAFGMLEITHLNVILWSPTWLVFSLAGALVFFGMAIAHLVNPNKFSLHAMYRDRLIRAYLGASNKARNPNPFTGFDENDNLQMRELWTQEKFAGKLLPIVNVALNLVGGSNLAWQERKAASFTISPLHCGSFDVGYRKTEALVKHRYGGDDGISLGTAITISGAAASPNMGYHSSALVTFILTLLNVRLGAWLGNPGQAGDKTFQLNYPNFSVRPIVAEALGLTSETNPYVYLSDGGHFENLGLYEMVLRRCHFIVVSDAGEDPACSFADLGGAIRKIRIDFGISIEFDDISIYARDQELAEHMAGRHAAIGRIRYSQVDGADAPDGVVVYIKPACYGNEPRDIYEYFKSNENFPHESTSDQFFTESQFESYRMLGVHTMDRICESSAGSFPDFIRALVQNHLKSTPSQWLETALATPNQPTQSA